MKVLKYCIYCRTIEKNCEEHSPKSFIYLLNKTNTENRQYNKYKLNFILKL